MIALGNGWLELRKRTILSPNVSCKIIRLFKTYACMLLLKTKAALPARCLSRMGIPTVSDDLSLTPSIYMMEEQTHKLSPDVYMCTMFSPTYTTNNVFFFKDPHWTDLHICLSLVRLLFTLRPVLLNKVAMLHLSRADGSRSPGRYTSPYP